MAKFIRAMHQVRAGEGRDAWAAFFVLFGLIFSHAILETARDALFLAKVPTSALPWVFLAVAAVSFALVRLQSRLPARLNGLPLLAAGTAAAAGVTFAFYELLDVLGSAGLYALYVWSGVLTTQLLLHFWTVVGSRFTVTQAKRLYGFIGAGSVIGAIAGSGTAGVLARSFAPRTLLVIAAAGFAVATLLSSLFRGGASARTAEATPTMRENLRYVRESPYARRVVLALFASSTCLTVSDFVFKSTIVTLVPKAQLGALLGTVYFGLNIASLVVQLGLVGFLLRRFSLGASLAILPVLLAFGAIGVALSGGIAALLVLKGVDGGLRHSLNRTATELLFIPFSNDARQRVKGVIDVIGQRGGQVVASIGILTFGASPLALAVLAAAWVATAIALREAYIQVFRARLKEGRTERSLEFPELDVASLETLIAALDSDQPTKVIAALGVLERENKAHLVPAVILHHPLDTVVEHALGIFMRTCRQNVVHVIHRLLDHSSPRVRAASIAAHSVLKPDPAMLLERLRTEESAEVRATITVNLIASGNIEAARLDELLSTGAPATHVALAQAIASRGAADFCEVLVTLASAKEIDVRHAAITAMGRVADLRLVPALIERLTDEPIRRDVIAVLLAMGDDALAALDERARQGGSLALRRRIPRAISAFAPAAAAEILVAHLRDEPDGSVRYQVIRALERLVRRDPTLALDRNVIDDAIQKTVARAFRVLDARLILTRGAPSQKTPGHELLRALFADKEQNAIERLFRLLGLAHPTEDFATIHRGLSGGSNARATSMELIEAIVREPLRSAVLALVDDTADDERLGRAGAFHRATAVDYRGLLDSLLEKDSEAVADLTAFHLNELQVMA